MESRQGVAATEIDSTGWEQHPLQSERRLMPPAGADRLPQGHVDVQRGKRTCGRDL